MPVKKKRTKRQKVTKQRTAGKSRPRKSTTASKTTARSGKKGAAKIPADRFDFPIVGIGASAGGLEALELFFSNLPSDTHICYYPAFKPQTQKHHGRPVNETHSHEGHTN